MITLIFKNHNNELQIVGYSTVKYKSSDKTEVLKDIDEEELKTLIGEDWRDNIQYLKIQNEDVVLDREKEELNETN